MHVGDQGHSSKVKNVDDWLPVTGNRNASWWYATFHNVTAMVGAGVLGLPNAMVYMTWSVPLSFFSLSPAYLRESNSNIYPHLTIRNITYSALRARAVGPRSECNSGMLGNLERQTQIQTELPASTSCCIPSACIDG